MLMSHMQGHQSSHRLSAVMNWLPLLVPMIQGAFVFPVVFLEVWRPFFAGDFSCLHNFKVSEKL